jgi:hypothetical protein
VEGSGAWQHQWCQAYATPHSAAAGGGSLQCSGSAWGSFNKSREYVSESGNRCTISKPASIITVLWKAWSPFPWRSIAQCVHGPVPPGAECHAAF